LSSKHLLKFFFFLIVFLSHQGGDLLELLKTNHPLGWKFRVKIALDIANALKYLHRLNLIHRDIKSSNMLLDHNWTCKLSDFGMARELIPDGDRASSSKRYFLLKFHD
jgi:serine/threonine protein kinase